jgi:hypothetical protein
MSMILIDSNTPGVMRHKISMVGWLTGDVAAVSFENNACRLSS